ncbi:F-box plant-like protein, putative [Medicago truncatula]|uniref:F-box plant-like protein, putative n=1 Tax=Medicago truncatula TaxID=3880 RepID=A0A072V6E0_MEDTR|nr:F-box plant-like protein, putative [Medicago truncatula]
MSGLAATVPTTCSDSSLLALNHRIVAYHEQNPTFSIGRGAMKHYKIVQATSKAITHRNCSNWIYMQEVVEVIKRKDAEDYNRLGNIALKVDKSLAIAGPLLTGIAAIGSTFIGNGSLAAFVPLLAGSLASAVNTFEHGGQVGMKDLEKRENGELFEMKMALQLGRNVSELRERATKSASCRIEGVDIDEFSSKLF